MIRLRTTGPWLFALFLLYGLSGAPSQAAGLQISPISLSIDANKKADEIWLRNAGDQVVHAQVRVYRWSQKDGNDVLTPGNELIASPPMVQIPAGQQQLVRLIRVGPLSSPAANERSYRLLVDELPVQQDQKTKAALNFVFRYSVPIFIVGTADQKPKLSWQVQESGQRAWLTVRNTGTSHVQLANVNFTPNGGKQVVAFRGLAGYVLPGDYRRLELPLPPSVFAQGGTFSSLMNGVKTNTDVSAITKQP
ncbi:MAG TPA: molecular chaperone [Castellaniella sp.]|uniref:fimbrial biogenesis chaperone n=1 Tax=Castellaniella sp. TaxID=1955812 RepID=UPI002EE20422